ncbi:Holliday junction resolvase [Candidatus Woesearchaeota archaeon]|nr:Holliday junction resolvase [Candidatus Woesearchaeota archaeon]
MSSKTKGTNVERELIHLFWQHKHPAIRVAGSGSSTYPSPDIIVSVNSKIYAIEVKSLKEKTKYLKEKEVSDLVIFAQLFKATPIIAIKKKREGWFYTKVKDLRKTPKGFSTTKLIPLNKLIAKKL